MSAWVNLDVYTPPNGNFVFHIAPEIQGGSVTGQGIGLRLQETGPGMQYRIAYPDLNITEYENTLPDYLGQWAHYTFIREGSTIRQYFNGRAIPLGPLGSSRVATRNTLLDLSQGGRIGASAFASTGSKWRIDGKIDQVRVYNRALSETEVVDLYAGNGHVTPELPGTELVRQFASSEPAASFSTEAKTGAATAAVWNYRRAITINNPNTANLSDYQVEVRINTDELIRDHRMEADGRDIRFTDTDGATLLPYYIESGINTEDTLIWVKVPVISGSGAKTIYLHYGNREAASASSFSSVFPGEVSGQEAARQMTEGSGSTKADSTDRKSDV